MIEDWDDVRVFLAVADEGTLARAGAALGVHASTVHRRVAALEAALGAPLFEKDPRGYRLTALGEALCEPAQDVAEAMQTLVRRAVGHDREAHGLVRLTTVPSLVPLLAPHLAEFRAAHPGIELELRVGARILALESEADVALRPSADPPRSAVGVRFGRVAWGVYGPAAAPWVVYRDMDHLEPVVWWRAQGFTGPTLCAVDGVMAMYQLLTQTPARGLLPRYFGDASDLPLDHSLEPDSTANLWMLIHADLRRSARVRALVDFLKPRLRSCADQLLGGAG